MNAEDAEALFSAAYDAELPPDERSAFERALARDPALAERYREFCATIEKLKQADELVPAPDLLRGVQRRLRLKSGGRFYADRFAERSGLGSQRLLMLSLLFVVLLVVASWILFVYFGDLSIVG